MILSFSGQTGLKEANNRFCDPRSIEDRVKAIGQLLNKGRLKEHSQAVKEGEHLRLVLILWDMRDLCSSMNATTSLVYRLVN